MNPAIKFFDNFFLYLKFFLVFFFEHINFNQVISQVYIFFVPFIFHCYLVLRWFLFWTLGW